jgi:hypothetical protein
MRFPPLAPFAALEATPPLRLQAKVADQASTIEDVGKDGMNVSIKMVSGSLSQAAAGGQSSH